MQEFHPKPLTGHLAQRRTSTRSMLNAAATTGMVPIPSAPVHGGAGVASTPEFTGRAGNAKDLDPLQLEASTASLDDSVMGLSTLNSTASSMRSVDASGKKRVSLSVSSPSSNGVSTMGSPTNNGGRRDSGSSSNSNGSTGNSPLARARDTRRASLANVQQQQRSPNTTAGKSLVTQFPQSVTGTRNAKNVWALATVEKNTSPCKALRFTPMIPEQSLAMKGKTTLVLDIDETLVHASFERCACDLRMKLDITPSDSCQVYVNFRPGLHDFLAFCCANFEVVAFTASQKVYADPLLNSLETAQVKFPLRLYREHCTSLGGSYVKDLHLLGRDLNKIAIVDNSPVCYTFQQRNAIPIVSWFSDRGDRELPQLADSLLRTLSSVESVYPVLDAFNSMMATGL